MDGQTDVWKTWHTDVGVPPNKQKIAENINNFFASVGKELQKKIHPTKKKIFIWKKKIFWIHSGTPTISEVSDNI